MLTLELAAGRGLLLIENFFDPQTCEGLLAELRAAQRRPATVYRDSASGVVDVRMRKATRIEPSPETSDFVRQQLLERKEPLEEHFSVRLSDCEEPQFLRYGVGDFFVAHQDGNTGLLKFDSERVRTVSITIFLNFYSETPAPGTYGGGPLVFHGAGSGGLQSGLQADYKNHRLHLFGEPGTLVAFPPETTHEVMPVTHGERYSIACWYR